MVIAWPNRIKDAGGIRHQFHHVIDIVPTILDAAGGSWDFTVGKAGQKHASRQPLLPGRSGPRYRVLSSVRAIDPCFSIAARLCNRPNCSDCDASGSSQMCQNLKPNP
jgi:hypothetical protein